MIGDDIKMNQKYDKPITYDELYEKIKKIIKKQDELDIINNAYGFALNKHEGRKRRNGDDYISHPLEVANILTDLNVDYVTLASAILHETINHGETTVDEIKEEFGEEIATIVHSLSKINRLELSDDKDSSAAYLRKVLVGLSEDVRVLFIKLADRLHNMRTLQYKKEFKQKENALETMEIFVPLAYYIGAYRIKSELEDISLRYLKPDMYKRIEERKARIEEDSKECLNEMLYKIENMLFCGDVLFSNSIGRSDLPTGNVVVLNNTLSRIKKMEHTLTLYPGHDECFILSDALKHNPYLK